MSHCRKHVPFVVHVRGAPDGRPLWGCRICEQRWTDGNPYEGDRVVFVATYDRFRLLTGVPRLR